MDEVHKKLKGEKLIFFENVVEQCLVNCVLFFSHIRCFKWNLPRYVLAQNSLDPEEETYVINIEDDEDLDERMKREADAGDFWATRWCDNFFAFYYLLTFGRPGGSKTFY